MAKRKTGSQTTEFLKRLYEDLPGGHVELRFRDVEGKIVKREWCSSFDRIGKLVEEHGAKDKKLAAYYGVAKRTDESKKLRLGKKAHILGTTTLWADIDTAKHGWDLQDTAKALYGLPQILQPNALVKSGGGLHAYWLLNQPIKFGVPGDVELVEDANKLLGVMCSGDRIFDITRVLRLPGSWNARAKKGVDTLYCFHWDKKPIDDLWVAAEKFGKVLGPTGFVLPKDMPKEYRKSRELDVENVVRHVGYGGGAKSRAAKEDAIWHNTRHGGGYPYYGINEAELLSTCNQYFIYADLPFEKACPKIVNNVLDRVEEVMRRGDPAELAHWNLDAEYDAIEEKLVRWHKQWAVLAKELRKKNLAEKKAKKLEEAARG